ncbi:MAG: type II toxin-antitoxin system VapC family toxin [Reyranella sp.]|uniref:type II toxin-antitoxin system VapC family toxin n=1 Tax=Reyranella sp. TaxID=1929291 RepID=UPI001AC46FE0|nr:type II toxin-antitoxin system VapC family toxin [Reyranella sp.]MBN9086947.1 type II toxin-antitoxin system VapC family toxin [Reyranella sp.]
MDLLLDTHAFIWWNAQDPRLAAVAANAISDPGNRIVVSAASVWEIAIKRKTGKLAFQHDVLSAIATDGFETIDITPQHADAAGLLPLHHADPFDRLLVAQARIDHFVLVTQDRQLLPYGVPLIGVT